MPGDKRVTFAETHLGPAGETTGEKAKTGTSPPHHKPTARSLSQFQDILAKTCEDFKNMKVRTEEELAQDFTANVDNKEALKKTFHEGLKLGGKKTGLALAEMLLVEFKAAVDGEVAAQEERHERERRERRK
ncbi:Phytanoyl-CoA dioxygenase [Lasiodiplodia theobromae]|uniref:Uncharacterized protein n=1 Tax=Lasiodiplodia theobromae TaxID=45133 RepID=A0A5N5DHY8_9PEZI|nr:hypothetical protein DBV05_g4131 [Lasiodiplodia theobromae]KAF9637583.1 Phytanoyl-CoA dioxygenase [Lasiodiplodia theobromae]